MGVFHGIGGLCFAPTSFISVSFPPLHFDVLFIQSQESRGKASLDSTSLNGWFACVWRCVGGWGAACPPWRGEKDPWTYNMSERKHCPHFLVIYMGRIFHRKTRKTSPGKSFTACLKWSQLTTLLHPWTWSHIKPSQFPNWGKIKSFFFLC